MCRYLLLWKLVLLQVGFCLLLIWLIYIWGLLVECSIYFFVLVDCSYLVDYVWQVEDVWCSEGVVGVECFCKELLVKEDIWVVLVGLYLESFGSMLLSIEELSYLIFMCKFDWLMSWCLQDELLYVSIEFFGYFEQGWLVIQLLECLLFGGLIFWIYLVIYGIVLILLVVLFGLLFYCYLVVLLNCLCDCVDVLCVDELESIFFVVLLVVCCDELGELVQVLEYMVECLCLSFVQQCLLLCILFYELCMLLVCLCIVYDSELLLEQLCQCLDCEIGDM